MKLLDSDHCIAVLQGRLDLREKIAPSEELAVTSISVGGLMHGAHKSLHFNENLARLDVLLADMVVLSYDEPAARRFGWLKAQLESAGERLNDLDLQVASIAIDWKTPLVTHNQRHFGRLVDLAGLILEDWL
jgi:tRNA(fMet)-specific endonuclease VapC